MIVNHLDRNDYRLIGTGDDTQFAIYSEITQREYYGSSLAGVRGIRDESERIKREHMRKGGE